MSAITPENVTAEEFAPAVDFTDTDTDFTDTDFTDTDITGNDVRQDDDILDQAPGLDAEELDGPEDVDFDDTETAEGDPVAFTELGLPEELVKKLADSGVHNTFPIQAATIPDALAGRHVLGKARTGSGKTLAFGLAALANLKGKRARKGRPLALVLVPTRELAMQVSEALQPYGFAVGADIAAVYGGAPMYKQVYALRRGVEVLVATPGRLTDLIEQQECDLSEVAIVVLDEADQMADMGFMPIVTELLSQTDPAGQRLLFSATLDGAVDQLVRQYMTDPVLHSVTADSDDQAQMDHHLLIVEPADKSMVTAEIAARHTPGDDDGRRTILFARTKLGADRIAEKIREAGVSALALHGGMTQRARTKTLADFKEGRVPVLVATDVAARGIHVDGIDLVLHVDPAGDPKDYLHRAGRTARAGESGTVVTLVLPKQRKATMRLLESAGIEAEMTKVAPSSAALRDLTGGRPVAEYVAEADAYHAARRAARETRTTDDRREGRDGYRGNREGGFRGGERRSFGDRDRFDRGHRGGRFEERDGGGSRGGFGGRDGGSRGSFGGERSGSGSGSGSGFSGNRGGSGRSFDRSGDRTEGRSGGFSGERSGSASGSGSGFGGGERRSYGDRDGARGGFGGQGSRGSEGRTGGFDRNSSARTFDRDNRSEGRSGSFSGERSGSGSGSGFGGGERRSYGDRDGARGGFGGQGSRGSEGRTGGFDRNSSARTFDRDNRSEGRSGSFGGERSGSGSGSGFGGGERRSYGDRDGARGGFGGQGSRGSEGRTGGFDRDNRGGERRSFGDRTGSQGRGFDRDNRGSTGGAGAGERRSYGDRDNRGGDRTGSQGRSSDRSGERRPYGGGENRGTGGERRSFGDRDNRGGDRGGFGQRGGTGAEGDRPAERPTFGERTAFGRPRGGYSNSTEQRDNRPPRDRRW